MLTFQIMLLPKYFLLNKTFLSTFLGLSTTDQFIYVTSIASRNLQDNIPNFQKTFPSCRGLCCGTVFVVYDNAFQQHTNADRLLHIVFFFFVQVYLKIIFSLQKLLNLGMKVLINNGNL